MVSFAVLVAATDIVRVRNEQVTWGVTVVLTEHFDRISATLTETTDKFIIIIIIVVVHMHKHIHNIRIVYT